MFFLICLVGTNSALPNLGDRIRLALCSNYLRQFLRLGSTLSNLPIYLTIPNVAKYQHQKTKEMFLRLSTLPYIPQIRFRVLGTLWLTDIVRVSLKLLFTISETRTSAALKGSVNEDVSPCTGTGTEYRWHGIIPGNS